MYKDIQQWLDSCLAQDIPEEAVAFCFNLYEDLDGIWSMELIASGRFDECDDDWACDEITDLGTRDCPFSWKSSRKWNEVLDETVITLKKYFQTGRYADVLKSRRGVGIGFVDGDLEIIYSAK